MKKSIFLGILLCLATSISSAETSGRINIGELLIRLDRVAEQYAERARSFTCEEHIRWDKGGETDRRKFGYVVVLDNEGNFDDYRTRLRSRERSDPAKRVEPADFGVPVYLRSAHLWLFIFRRDRWRFHHYDIVAEDELFDRPAVVIRFEPIPPYREKVNNWYGTAWVDEETAQLLRVEAHRPDDHEELQRVESHRAGEAVSSWVYDVQYFSTEFTVEKRGMRFPGLVEMREIHYDFRRGLHDFKKQERTVLWVYQTYSDYRFFEVESTVDLGPADEEDR